MEVRNDKRTGWRAAILIAVAVLAGYMFTTTRSTLWDRDEPRFARATVEMVESGNYLYPTFNGNLRPDKPILIYWLMSVPVRLLGQTELAVRLPSALGTALTCLLVFFIGRQIWDARTGLWAMGILATSGLMLFEGTAATADGTLLPCMVAAMAVFVHAITTRLRFYHLLLMGVAFGLALLTKGPVGLLPITAIVTTLVIDRKRIASPGRHALTMLGALVIGALLFIAWGIPANNATGGELYRLAVGHHVVERATKPLEGHGGQFLLFLFFYVPVVIAGFFPWILFLPGAISFALGRRLRSRHGGALLIGWIVPTFVIMTLVATKLPHYILFIWPALALLTAATLVQARPDNMTKRDRDWLRGGLLFAAPIAIPLALALILAPWFLPLPGMRRPGAVAGAALLAAAILTARPHYRDQVHRSARIMLVGIIVFLLALFVGVLPATEAFKLSPSIARAIRAQTDPNTPVVAYGFLEPTLIFYLDRPIEALPNEEAVAHWAQDRQPGVLVVTKAALERVQQQHGMLPLVEIARKEGVNYSKGDPEEILALSRKDPPR
ncbi:MAG: glycosyltransferase family 39 protein [Sedimentisphaerales bacterium]|nr:glycosyltransferase family 39 protein [Sedimentisphaerales bacterium]